MKTTHTTFNHGFFKSFKRFSPSGSEYDFWKITQIMANNYPKIGLDKEIHSTDILACWLWKYRRLNHYYLSDGLADFLIGSVKEVSIDYWKALPDCDDVPMPKTIKPWMKGFLLSTDGENMGGGFVIHFPVKEQRRSIIVIPNIGFGLFGEVGAVPHVSRNYFFGAVDGVDIVMENPLQRGEDGYEDSGQREISKLILGFGLYLEAFPDAVVETKRGDGGCFNSNYQGKQSLVSATEIANSEMRHSISPHWRRGHFRMLNSERFTKKQGSVVFIKGMFIKGRSFEVLTDLPAIA